MDFLRDVQHVSRSPCFVSSDGEIARREREGAENMEIKQKDYKG